MLTDMFPNEKAAYRKTIAINIKLLRVAHGMTQFEIGEKIGVNGLTYRGYENCKSDIPLSVLIRLSKFYGVSLDSFISPAFSAFTPSL